MIIENVEKISITTTPETQYLEIHIDSFPTKGEESFPGVVYVPIEACVYFVDNSTVKVEM